MRVKLEEETDSQTEIQRLSKRVGWGGGGGIER